MRAEFIGSMSILYRKFDSLRYESLTIVLPIEKKNDDRYGYMYIKCLNESLCVSSQLTKNDSVVIFKVQPLFQNSYRNLTEDGYEVNWQVARR